MNQPWFRIAGILFVLCFGSLHVTMAGAGDTPEGRSAYAFDQAIQQYLKGDSNRAIKLLNQSLQYSPTNNQAKVFLLKILVERGSRLFLAKKYKTAYKYLSQAYNMDPDNKQVRQMYELVAKQVAPQDKKNRVMLIPKGMQQELLKKEAEDTTRAEGGVVLSTVPTGRNQRKQNADSGPVLGNGRGYTNQDTVEDGREPSGDSPIMEQYAKNVAAMTNLMAMFTKSQEKQMEQYMAPLERIQNLYYQSEQDRKNFMNRLDSQFKNVLGDVSFQQRMVIYGFIIGLGLLGVLAYIFYLIVKRMRSKREEIIMKYQQEMLKMVRDMAGLPGASTYGMLGSGNMMGSAYRLNPAVAPQAQLMGGFYGAPNQPPMPGQTPPVAPNSQPEASAPAPANQSTGTPPQAGEAPGIQPGGDLEAVIQSGNYKERSLAVVQLLDIDAERALDYIGQMIKADDPFQRESMFFALGEKVHPLTLELIIEGLRDGEKRVADAAARSLRRLSASADPALTEQMKGEINNALAAMGKTRKSGRRSARSK